MHKSITFATAFGLVLIMASALTGAYAEQPVGVKVGDWAEYNVTIVGNPPSVHLGLVWMRMEVLEVQGAAFPVNVTERYANGTVHNSIWNFNFTEGNTEGWLIIPPNLNPGDTFFDNYSKADKNIVILSQEQKIVLGATRIVTYGNDSYRDKYWDKTTGVFVSSTEVFKNWSAYVDISATNLWIPEPQKSNNSMFYPLVAAAFSGAAGLSLLIVVARRKHVTLSTKQQTIVGGMLVLGLIAAVGIITSTPISENQVPLSFRDINVIMQTLWLTLLLVSMWFRKKGNYLIHGILLIAVVSITIVSFVGVLVMSPMNSTSMQGYFGSPVDIAVFFAHAVFSFPALVFGLWLIALWRPSSPSYRAKSRRIAWLVTVFWVLSYIVGILDYLIIRIHLLG
jgi:uncharacterized membrane protein YozB (DUF420 family)